MSPCPGGHLRRSLRSPVSHCGEVPGGMKPPQIACLRRFEVHGATHERRAAEEAVCVSWADCIAGVLDLGVDGGA